MGRTVTLEVADVVVEGKVESVGESKGVLYVRFGAPSGSFAVSCSAQLGSGLKVGDDVRIECDVLNFRAGLALRAIKVGPGEKVVAK